MNGVFYPRLSSLFRIPINFSASGNNTVISADATRRIVIHRLWLVVSAATNLTFVDNLASPAAIPMGQYGALVFDTTGDPWFITNPATAFVINQSGTAQVSGCVHYSLSL